MRLGDLILLLVEAMWGHENLFISFEKANIWTKIPTVDEFEKFLNLWEELYALDDAFYHKIISELTLDVDSKIAYSFLIRFLELWGIRRATARISPTELSQKISDLKPILTEMDMGILDRNFKK